MDDWKKFLSSNIVKTKDLNRLILMFQHFRRQVILIQQADIFPKILSQSGVGLVDIHISVYQVGQKYPNKPNKKTHKKN